MDGTEILSTVERYEPCANTWTLVTPLPQALRFTISVSLKGKLFVFVWEGLTDVVNSAYRYDPTDGVLTELAPMSVARVLAGSMVHHGKIYIIGGNGQISDKWKREFYPSFASDLFEIYAGLDLRWSQSLFDTYLSAVVRAWNAIPHDIRNSPTLTNFKRAINQNATIIRSVPSYYYLGSRIIQVLQTHPFANVACFNQVITTFSLSPLFPT